MGPLLLVQPLHNLHRKTYRSWAPICSVGPSNVCPTWKKRHSTKSAMALPDITLPLQGTGDYLTSATHRCVPMPYSGGDRGSAPTGDGRVYQMCDYAGICMDWIAGNSYTGFNPNITGRASSSPLDPAQSFEPHIGSKTRLRSRHPRVLHTPSVPIL